MNLITKVSFPGLGIEETELSKVAFSLFDKLQVRWYGIFITIGIVLAFAYAVWRGKRYEKVSADDVIDVGIVAVVLGILGARLYYVLTTMNDGVHHYNGFGDVIAVWNGGLAIYGGIIGGLLGVALVALWKKIRLFRLTDMIFPGVMLAQALGRWGNFFNGEAYGSVIGETFQFDFFNHVFEVPAGEGSLFYTFRMGLGGSTCYHPTFLYESVWNLLGFLLIHFFYKHKRFDGQISLMYCTWYGFGRMLIEGLRTDSLYIPGTQLRISQCLACLCFVIGGIALLVLSVRYRDHRAFATDEQVVSAHGTVRDGWTHTEETRFGRLVERILQKKRGTDGDARKDETNDGDEN